MRKRFLVFGTQHALRRCQTPLPVSSHSILSSMLDLRVIALSGMHPTGLLVSVVGKMYLLQSASSGAKVGSGITAVDISPLNVTGSVLPGPMYANSRDGNIYLATKPASGQVYLYLFFLVQRIYCPIVLILSFGYARRELPVRAAVAVVGCAQRICIISRRLLRRVTCWWDPTDSSTSPSNALAYSSVCRPAAQPLHRRRSRHQRRHHQ